METKQGQNDKTYKFITIKESKAEKFKNKPLYLILNNKSGSELGKIFYYTPWKQYCFTQSAEGMVFSHDCLDCIIDFIKSLK